MSPWLESFLSGATNGLANSVHCACMCGPLALTFQGGIGGRTSYHLGRASAYGAIGVVLGGLGSALGAEALGTPTAWVAFALAAGLLLFLVVGERGTVAVPGLGRLLQRGMAATRRLPPTLRAGLLGLATPLLPCSLLWATCAAAALAGSPLDGACVMLGFALGSLPLLVLAQAQAGWLARRFGPTTLRLVQRGAMLLAAGVLVWRGILALQGQSCCH